MPYPYVTATQVRARLGARLIERLCDEDGDGLADTDILAELMDDASAHVASGLIATFGEDALRDNTPREVVRLTLDFVESMAIRRYPGASPEKDWVEMYKLADRHLDKIRDRKRTLGTDGPPEPAANAGGEVVTVDEMESEHRSQWEAW